MNPYNQGKCQSVVHLIYNDCKEEKKKSCLEVCYMLPRTVWSFIWQKVTKATIK